MNLTSIERRVGVLEKNAGMMIDPERAAVDAFNVLSENEFCILCEYKELLNAGFGVEEISRMMKPDSYQAALEVTEKVDKEYGRLIGATRPKQPARHNKHGRKPQEKKVDDEYDCDEGGVFDD